MKEERKGSVANPITRLSPFTIMQFARKYTWLAEQTTEVKTWKREMDSKKYNEKRVWVEREESWECKIAPPSGNRIILWADGSSLCVGWHFPVTPSQVMLCDVCDWLLPRPWEATEPWGHLLLAHSILGIVYFSSVCSFLPVFLSLCGLLPHEFSPCLPSGVYFELKDNALPFFGETGDGVTQSHALSIFIQIVFQHLSIIIKSKTVSGRCYSSVVYLLYMLLCVIRLTEKKEKTLSWKSRWVVYMYKEVR